MTSRTGLTLIKVVSYLEVLLIIFLQDLELLGEGLEGRSKNPVALLFDTLLRPDTDVDSTHPSSLRWEYDPAKAIPHVVVGRGRPGGCWQFMDPHVKTLSLDRWLELPLYSFQEWKSDQKGKKAALGDVTDDAGQVTDGVGQAIDYAGHVTEPVGDDETENDYGRVSCGEIARYYSDYVVKMGLGGNFVDNTEVTQASTMGKKCASLYSPISPTDNFSLSSPPSLPPVPSTCSLANGSISPDKNCTPLDSPICHSQCSSSPPSSPSSLLSSPSLLSPASPIKLCLNDEKTVPMAAEKLTEICTLIFEREDCGIVCNQGRSVKHKWCLSGSQETASGSNSEGKNVSILSQRLVLACGVNGTPRRLEAPGEEDVGFLSYTLPEFSKGIRSCSRVGTVLVVGAGLSAADAVLVALRNGARVLHVFEQDPNNQKLIFRQMSDDVYPDYLYVYRLMLRRESSRNYACRARSSVTHLREGEVTVASGDGTCSERWDDVVLGGVFLGSNADLGFLPEALAAKLGSVSGSGEINAKHNPVAADPISFVTEASSSLYAIGALVGDNFVRFGVGSALGAAQHIARAYDSVT